jgi:hypothetical protein
VAIAARAGANVWFSFLVSVKRIAKGEEILSAQCSALQRGVGGGGGDRLIRSGAWWTRSPQREVDILSSDSTYINVSTQSVKCVHRLTRCVDIKNKFNKYGPKVCLLTRAV